MQTDDNHRGGMHYLTDPKELNRADSYRELAQVLTMRRSPN